MGKVQFLVGMGLTLLVGSNVSFAQVTSGDSYRIVTTCGAGDKVMSIAGDNTANAAQAVLASKNLNSSSQIFKIESSNGAYKITAQHSGRSLDVKARSTANNALIQQYDFHGGTNQLFKIQSTSKGIQFQNVNSGRYVNLKGGYAADGQAFIQYQRVSNCAQFFKLEKVSLSTSPPPPPPPASCTFNGQTIASGSSVSAYQYSSVSYGSSCTSESRTCSNGSLSGSYQYSSCSVAAAASCTFNGQTIASGSSISAYETSSVPYGSTCSSQSRTCSNGSLSGGYQYSSCSVAAAASCTFNGQTIASGNSVTAYQASSVPSGSTCTTQSRTCSNGTLSGSYQYPSCSVAAPAGLITIDQAIADMSSTSEVLPIDPIYDHQKRAGIQMFSPAGTTIPAWFPYSKPAWCTNALTWYVLYEAQGNAATNTLVEIKNLRMYFLSNTTRQWTRADISAVPYADMWKYPFTYADVANVGNKLAPKYPNFYHGYGNNYVLPNPKDIRGAFVAAEFRLIVKDPTKPDDRHLAKYVLDVGGDYWPGNGEGADWGYAPGMGNGRFLLATPDWRTATMLVPNTDMGANMSEMKLNPPPLAAP